MKESTFQAIMEFLTIGFSILFCIGFVYWAVGIAIKLLEEITAL